MTAWVRSFGMVGAVALGILCAPSVRAEEKKIKVSVLVIIGSEKDSATHPKLCCIAEEVSKIDKKLIGFRCVKVSCESVKPKQKIKIELIDKQFIGLEVQKGVDKNNRVRVCLRPPFLGEIIYKTPCGKFLPIVTRYRPKEHERLILAIRVQPCNRGK